MKKIEENQSRITPEIPKKIPTEKVPERVWQTIGKIIFNAANSFYNKE